ncbi:FKBP-type peptidyl-prolyl cis-trans isomerase [Maribacter sp. CXY002]|uniref:FKBP-type peptidyl-prolyl cis-trans isomerase n=1 Tax=Maribacter luteocoastalis TaxID=3407671 RepID=UPI003B66EB65
MKFKNVYFLVLTIILVWSCKKDDDSVAEVVPPRLLSEVAVEDDAEILEFLSTHTFNYEDFRSPTTDFDFKIKFDTITSENSDQTSILNINTENIPGMELITETISVASSEFSRDDEEVIDHKLYVLVARQGTEEGKPTIGDNVNIRYEGSLLDGTLFDASSEQPIRFNLSNVVRGFGNGVEYFQTGMGPIENGDGTITYNGYGVGALFIPSGLAYFASAQGSVISAYTPLIFKIDTFSYEPDTDFDGDGIPSILEDVNNDGNLNNDNTDDESEPFTIYLANYNDTDDDADGIPTIEEINLKEDGSFDSFKDTDGDGIYDHLDNDL